MKKNIFVTLLSVCYFFCSLQSQPPTSKIYKLLLPKLFGSGAANGLTTIPTVDCSVLGQPSGCNNFIDNHNFTPSSLYDPNNQAIYIDPFTTTFPPHGYIPRWEAAQGDPNIDDIVSKYFYGVTTNPPPPATGYASMYAGYLNNFGLLNEGIAQKIPKLTLGNKYCFSFFKLFSKFAPYNGESSDLNIVLMHCSDFPLIYPPDPLNPYVTPNIPPNTQVIYCETGMNNQTWQQKVISFVSNGDYDMIWVFPKGRTGQGDYGSVVDFAYPQLINVNNFTAGTNPAIPTQPNCTVTIGPATPNVCTVINAVFTWHGPNGQIITAPPNQQIQVDASITTNIGTWTLTMNALNEMSTNNSCSQSLSASVVVGGCVPPSVWPKEFNTNDGGQGIMKDNKGNIVVSAANINNTNPFYNHSGNLPPLTYQYSMTFQYTSSGVTNWTKQWTVPLFTFKSGIIQTHESNLYSSYDFIDGTSGNIVAPPISTLISERVLAETNSDVIISIAVGNILKAYTSAGALITSLNIGFYPSISKYNLNTNNLILQNTQNMQNIQVFHFDGTNFVQISNTNLPISGGYYEFVQSDNNDRIYFVDYLNNIGTLKEYNYTTLSVNTVNIPGFNNTDLARLQLTGSFYAEDRYIVYNNTDNYLYLLDFSNQSTKKILTSNFAHSGQYYYIIDGEYAYLTGNIYYLPITIGNQIIPSYYTMFPSAGNAVPVFITKLSLQNDFNFRIKEDPIIAQKEMVNTNSLNVNIRPNPSVNDIVFLQIIETNKTDFSGYQIKVSNQFGKVVLSKSNYLSNTSFNIGSLQKGVYYVEIINPKGQRTTKSFVKL